MTSSQGMLPRRTRGMRDLLPGDMRAFRRVEDAFRAAASRWGYQEVRTPSIEAYSLFTAAGALTPQMLSRVYTFLDWDGWSGERVVLRPDSTVPVGRAAVENELPLPARLFYVQNSFRFSPAAVDAETWQCGLEYIGAPGVVGDVEVAAIGCETLESLGIAASVHLSHVGIARGIVEALRANGVTVGAELRTAVTTDGLAALRDAAAGSADILAFLEVACRQSDDPALLMNLRALAPASVPGLGEAVDEARALVEALQRSGRSVIVDLAMPADFEYYTGTVFEYRQGDVARGRGGRYELCGPLGNHAAAGLGLEATVLASQISRPDDPPLIVAVVPAAPSDLGRAIDVARTLHRNDIPASLEPALNGRAIGIRVAGDTLEAQTPDGPAAVASLDALVPLLLKYK